MYKFIIKPFLFFFDPEKVHYFVFDSLIFLYKIPGIPALFKSLFCFDHGSLAVNAFGLTFKNPVGLAAGFDKNALLIDQLADLGFGHVEIGTITPKAQPGNDKPRLFRLPQDNALINRMGFNNDGIDAAVAQLKKRKSDIIVGGNIGKNKNTPNEEASSDYQKCFIGLFDYVDYFVVNVSSPNTPNLRALQEKGPLTQILSDLQVLNNKKPKPKPILLKIAPDLTESQLDDIIDIVQITKIAGLIATNTTIERSSLSTSKNQVLAIGAGGVSGQPVRQKSTEVIDYIHQKSKGNIPIIGVGGISNATHAQEKLAAGSQLVQVYTGFIYEGPSLASKICKGLANFS